jgi:putative glutamine amidotransferase
MRIGIPTFSRNDMVGVHPDYLDLIEEVGTPILISPWDTLEDVKRLKVEGFVLPGGSDVDSKRYQPFLPRFLCYPPDWDLETFDTEILPHFISKNFPIFGICRGLQTLNVHFGGTLYRHLQDHPMTNIPFTKKAEDLVHGISFTHPMKSASRTNSFHHQAIRKLGKGLEIIATAEPDGVVEAIRHKEFPIFAVQWHPERNPNDNWSRKIMKGLFA